VLSFHFISERSKNMIISNMNGAMAAITQPPYVFRRERNVSFRIQVWAKNREHEIVGDMMSRHPLTNLPTTVTRGTHECRVCVSWNGWFPIYLFPCLDLGKVFTKGHASSWWPTVSLVWPISPYVNASDNNRPPDRATNQLTLARYFEAIGAQLL